MKVSMFRSFACMTAVLAGSTACQAAAEGDAAQPSSAECVRQEKSGVPVVTEPLHEIVRDGAVGRLMVALGYGADVNEKDEAGYTPLMLAACLRQKEMMPLLLEAGADPRVRDEYGNSALMLAFHCLGYDAVTEECKDLPVDEDWQRQMIPIIRKLGKEEACAVNNDGRTVLMCAAAAGAAECVSALAELGADVNAAVSAGITALMFAADSGASDCVSALVKHGADVNAASFVGTTALMFAVQQKDEQSVQALIKAGADVRVKNKYGRSALNIASGDCYDSRSVRLVRMLAEAGADLQERDFNGRTALMRSLLYLSKDDCAEDVLSLVRLWGKAAVTDRDADGRTVLMLVAAMGLPECAEALMERGANVNERDAGGRTVLMYAAEEIDDEVGIQYLLEAGAEINAGDAEDCTALMYAAAAGNENVVQEMLDAGADINARDRYGRTALMYACLNDCINVAEVLLDAGADSRLKDGKGRTALMYYCLAMGRSSWAEEMLELLLKAGAEVNVQDNAGLTPLAYAIRNANAAVVNRLLAAGADANAKDVKGRTALMLAAQEQAYLSELLQAGAEVNVQDQDGRTALMYAVKQREEVADDNDVKLLLKAGATVDARDIYGRTALMYASWYRRKDCRTAIDALLEAGADSRLKDGNGYTAARPHPLMAALRDEDWDAVKRVVKNGPEFPDKDVTDIIPVMLKAVERYDHETLVLLLQSGKQVDAWSSVNALSYRFMNWNDGEELPPYRNQHGSRMAIASLALFLRHSCYHDADILNTLPYMSIDSTGICRYLCEREGGDLLIEAPGIMKSTWCGTAVPENGNPDVDLQCAVIENDMDAVKRALQNGANPNMRDAQNCSILVWAALCGNVECVKLLLKHNLSAGAAFLYPDCSGMETTPEICSLMSAASAASVQKSPCYAPDSLAGKSLVMDYTDAQFCGRDSIGKYVWVPLARATSLSGLGTSPKATRHLFPLNDDDKGTYNYSKTSGRTGHLSVKPENGESFTARFYELTFTSPTGGTAVEMQYREADNSAKEDGDPYKTYCQTRGIRFRVENEKP